MQEQIFLTANTILYSDRWKETVQFYRNALGLRVTFSSDWFVELSLNETARLSIADQERASVKSAGPEGITIALQVRDIGRAWHDFNDRTLDPSPIQRHPWQADVFYLFDPEGRRIEIWQAL